MKSNNKVIKEQRTSLLHCRIKGSIMELLNQMIERKQKITPGKVSQADIIEAALLFADGQVFTEKIKASKKRLQKGKELIQSGKQLLIDTNGKA